MITHVSFKTVDGSVVVVPKKRLYLLSQKEHDGKSFTATVAAEQGTETYELSESTFTTITELLCSSD